MQCPSCAAENSDDRAFCAACGAPLPWPCPGCGFRNEAAARFCGGCGAPRARAAPAPAAPRPSPPAASDGEIRQVTILFADLAGFTQLTAELESEQVHELLGHFFEAVDGVVKAHGGTIDKHIGDCAMAVFGAPVAHSNDPERAVHAALRIHEALEAAGRSAGRPLRAHVGIASGQVVASGTGSTHHREYTMTGESVNLAERLTGRAAAGETLLSDAVHQAVGSQVDCEPLGDVLLKGIARPVKAWRLIGLGEGGAEDRRPIVGRRTELRQLTALLDACVETGAGRAVHVRGEAGIGKSRLVAELRKLAAARGFACHVGAVLDFGIAAGQNAVRSLLRGMLPDGPSGNPAIEQALEADPAERVFLNDLLELPQPVALRASYDAMNEATRRGGRRQALASLVKLTSAERPLLLLVEDVHWADADALAQLATLCATTSECPAIVVMTSRIEGDPLDPAWRAAAGRTPLLTIDLGPLRRDDALSLASALMAEGGPLITACVDRADGNPLFLEQLLRGTGPRADEVPGSIQSLVLARMDRLSPPDRRAIQAASVIGQRFPLEMLRHLLGDPGYGCTALVDNFLVRPDQADYMFAHALIRDGVYSSLLKARRRELHRSAAAWYAGRDLLLEAEHLDRAEDAGAPQAYRRAAEGQFAAYRVERARQLVERGLALATAPADRFALAALQADIAQDLGRSADALAAYEQALALAGGEAERCRALIGIAAALRILDQNARALTTLEEAEALATRASGPAELARIHHLRGNLYFPIGRIEGCREQHELALGFARAAGSPELEARALGGLGDAFYLSGHLQSSHRHFAACVRVCRERGFGRIELANLPMMALTGIFNLDLRAALADTLAAIAAAGQAGQPRAETIARHGAHIVLVEFLELEEAEKHTERALGLARQLGSRRFEAEAFAFLAEIRHVAGKLAEARDLALQSLAINREVGMSYQGPLSLGLVAATAQDAEERRSALAEGDELLAAGSLAHNHLWFRRYGIELALAEGAWDEAERHADALAAYTASEPVAWSDFLIARGRALAAHGRGHRDAETTDALRRTLETARGAGLKRFMPELEAALAAG
jgi:class 3 adenylate cyclase/tetratricopeptide (TPR) repeat protein